MKIVLDLFYPYDDKVFSSDEHTSNFGISWIPILYALAKEEGIKVLLASDYLREGNFSNADIFISEGYTKNTLQMMLTNAKPFVLFSCESPNVDWKFYTFISKYSRAFKYTMMFSGCGQHINKRTGFVPLFWPNNTSLPTAIKKPERMEQKRRLVMIAANKKQSISQGTSWLIIGLKWMWMKALTNIVPSVRLKDLYAARMKAIKFFSGKDYFDLYGKGWDNFEHFSSSEKKAVIKLNPQPVDDKIETLAEYQFALCFENCIYPGYITEKIFDCFSARCIPVYMGAPDIEKFIPADLFIDMRSFRDFVQLDVFIKEISQAQITGYLTRIESFLNGELYKKFTDISFAHKVFSLATCHDENFNSKSSLDKF